MTCHNCRIECKNARGRDRKGNQRYQCRQCCKFFQEAQGKPLEGMYTRLDKAEQVLKMLVEGCSINTVERVTGITSTTILKLSVLVGEKCEKLIGRLIVNALGPTIVSVPPLDANSVPTETPRLLPAKKRCPARRNSYRYC